MTRKEQAMDKFEKSLTEKQKKIVREEILRQAISDAKSHMAKTMKATLYPSVIIYPSPQGLATLIFNYGYATRQLWGKKSDGNWGSYKYGN